MKLSAGPMKSRMHFVLGILALVLVVAGCKSFGKIYAASGPRIEVPEAFVMFRIQDGKAIRNSD